jgi:hypothetical protein
MHQPRLICHVLSSALLAGTTLSGTIPVHADGYLPECPAGYRKPTQAVARIIIPADTDPGSGYLAGTVWFVSRQQVIAILHEHAAILADWTEITIQTGNVIGEAPTDTTVTYARIQQTIDTGAPEKLYVIELADTFTDIEVPRVRFGGLSNNEPVFSLTYQDGLFQLVTGRYLAPQESTDPEEPGEPPPPFLMFELADPEETNRLAIDHGSSGSPIFDCQGQVVASAAIVLSRELRLFGATTRVSTAWGSPNVFGTPTGAIVVP